VTVDIGAEIAKIDLFAGQRAEDLAALVSIAQPVRFEPAQTIYRAGDAGDSLYVIVEGAVVVRVQDDNGEDVDVARLKAGSYFGEMEVIGGTTRTAAIVGETDGRAYRFAGNVLLDLLGRSDRLAAHFYRQLSCELVRRLKNTTRDMGYFKARAI
jgi:CRP-like cAMP-binding protein